MPQITLEIPAMLQAITGHTAPFTIEATSVDNALQSLCESHPEFRMHFFDNTNRVQPQILFALNDSFSVQDFNGALAQGDHVCLIHSVSGG